MKLLALSLLGGTLLFLGAQAAPCAPTFSASATLTAPAAQSYVADVQSGPYWGKTLMTKSTNQYVDITGEPANASVGVQYDLYLSNGSGNSPDDFYSDLRNPIRCDQDGKYRHYALNSSPGVMSNTNTYFAYMHTTNFTVHAVADIFDQGNQAYHGHADSPVAFTVTH